jgi:hypothetical protein
VLSDILDLSDLALLVSALIGTALAGSGFEGLVLAGPGSITLGSIEPGIETGVDSTSIIL